MRKTTYIFILLLFSANFFDLQPIGQLFAMLNGVVGLLFLYIWLVYGVVIYKKKSDHCLCIRQNVYPAIWILVGIIVSMIPAYLYYGQSFITSIIAYRVQYFWLVIPLLLYIKPKTKDIIQSLNVFAFLLIVLSLFRSFWMPSLFYFTENQLHSAELHEGEVFFLSGLPLLLIPFYYYVGEIKKKLIVSDLVKVALYLLAFFIIQNRSTLFIATAIVGYAIMTKKTKYKFAFLTISFIVILIVVYFTIEIWIDLINETTSQVADNDYNRVKSFYYFVYEANKNEITTILGNGFLSANTTSLMQDMMDLGIFNSDLGFIGYWNQFGILPVVVFLTYTIKSCLSKKCPFFVKAISIHILGCSMTISYFAMLTSILWFAIFYYLFVYYKQLSSNKTSLIVE